MTSLFGTYVRSNSIQASKVSVRLNHLGQLNITHYVFKKYMHRQSHRTEINECRSSGLHIDNWELHTNKYKSFGCNNQPKLFLKSISLFLIRYEILIINPWKQQASHDRASAFEWLRLCRARLQSQLHPQELRYVRS